jgi:hypothetical protein
MDSLRERQVLVVEDEVLEPQHTRRHGAPWLRDRRASREKVLRWSLHGRFVVWGRFELERAFEHVLCNRRRNTQRYRRVGAILA